MADAGDQYRQYPISTSFADYLPTMPVQDHRNAIAGPYEPRNVSDNLPPMLMDLYRALGIPESAHSQMANKMSNALSWSPPVAAVDSAGIIGRDLHDGNYGRAALDFGVMQGLGLAGYGAHKLGRQFIPTEPARDAWQAAYRETMPGRSATSYVPQYAEGMQPPVNLGDLHRGYGHAYFNGVVPANVNGRSNMRPYLMTVE